MSSMTCGVGGCEGGGVNCDSVGVLCSACGVVGGDGVPFGSAAAGLVLVCVGGVGGGEMEAGAAIEIEASSSSVTGLDLEALRAFEELAFSLPPAANLPSFANGPFFVIPPMGQ